MKTTSHPFSPAWVSAPGETIRDALYSRDVGVDEFATAMGLTRSAAEGLLRGEQVMSLGLARQLERVVGGSAEFWMMRDFHYRRGEPAMGSTDWLRLIPVGEMTRWGWIRATENRTDRVKACLEFFGVPTVAAWQARFGPGDGRVAFRTSSRFRSNPGATAAWLRKGEIEAAAMSCRTWEPLQFRAALTRLRTLTKVGFPSRFVPVLQRVCAASGVAVVIVRGPRGCRASGATRFLDGDRAVILLSFRHLTDDQFWFTFFHEAGHLLLHEARLRQSGWTLDEADWQGSQEDAANEFAEKVLIPSEFRAELETVRPTVTAVVRFAVRAGISPGIVVGQLQHRGLARDRLNGLKRHYSWVRG